MASSTIVVKVQYNDTLRRFNASIKDNGELELDLVALKAKILGLFDLPVDADVTLTYVDEDGDIVTLVDDNDLSDVMMQRLKFLRINVLLNNGRGARPYARSSAGSTPMRSPRVLGPSDSGDVFGTSQLQDMPAVFKLVSRETLHDALSKLSVDLASKASSSSQVAGEIVDCVSKLGLSCLKNEQPSQCVSAPGRGKRAIEVSMSLIPTAEEPVPFKDDLRKDPASKSEVKTSFNGFTTGPLPFSAVGGEIDGKKQQAAFPVVKPLDSFTAARSALPDRPLTNESPITGTPAAACPFNVPKFQVPTIPFRNTSFSYGPKVGLFHKGVQCDGCGAHPIVGPRFKSKVKDDYDLCSICFTEMGKEGQYEVIERPIGHRHPRSFKGIHNMNNWMPPPPPPPPSLSPHMIRRNGWTKPAKAKLDSRFILDVNVLDGTIMGPSTSFTKIWRLRNSGTITWPKGARLVWIGGDKFSTADMMELEIPGEGLPIDGELDIAVDFTSPQLPGRYISYWRMALPSGLKFGQRVWVLIQVDASLEESCYSSYGLNLNLPPASALHNTSQVVDLNAQPAAESGLMDQSNSATAPHPMEPLVDEQKDQNLSFPIDDSLLIGPGASSPAPLASAPPEATATSTISYPIIDLLPEAASPGNTSAMMDSAKDVETTILKELEEMGFKEVDLNTQVLRTNKYDLEKSVDAFCGFEDWDPLLGELQEMGFNDTEMKKKLLKKNKGSIKRAVMDLLAGEKA